MSEQPEQTGSARCTLCQLRGPVEDRPTAEARGVWHIYEKHPKVWRTIFGERPPEMPKPGEPGTRPSIIVPPATRLDRPNRGHRP